MVTLALWQDGFPRSVTHPVPVLLIHEDSDDIVPFEHSARMHEALLQAAAASELGIIPGGG